MPITADQAVDAGEKIAKVLPIGIFTAFQYIAAQITVAFCTPIQKVFFITFLAIFTVLCAALAVTMRYRGDTSLKPLPKGKLKKQIAARLQNFTGKDRAAAENNARKQVEEEHENWERKKQHLLYWARAVGCATIFLALALLTSPAPTCLFRKGDSNDSLIPPYVNACVCTTVLFILSAFAQLDGVVTPPALGNPDKKKHAGDTDEESHFKVATGEAS